ncbi:MAG: hypothetical protein AAF198_04645 [Pseudomonadota bacterium]
MTKDWEEIDSDPQTGRRIFKRETDFSGGNDEYKVEAEFEVRNAVGDVLYRTAGTGKGERWAGTFLYFATNDGEIRDGTRLRLMQSSYDDAFFDLPKDAPPL